MKRRELLLASAAACLAGPALTKEAYPTRPITVIVPFAAGGSTDLVVRPLAIEMEKHLGAPLVIVNRAGAGGAIGAQAVARAKPDGYTLLVGSAGPIVVNPIVRSNIGYRPTDDFEPVAIIGTQPLALAVNPGVPANNLAELVKLYKQHKDGGFFASSGMGSLPHLTGELLRSVTGAKVSHVAYQGGGPAVQATLAGETQMLFDALVSLIPHQNANALRVLAVCDHQRSPLLKQVPTVAEAGFPDLVSTTSNYLLAPKGTPAEVVKAVANAAQRVMKDPAMQARMEQVGVRFDPALVGPRVSEVMKQEIAKWSAVVQRAHIKLD
jgi:tripartite-type tricarboxylate transporter receptor subunit TctC